MEYELIFSGFSAALQPQNMLFIIIGLLFGVFIGSLPGMTATMGVAVMVPFSYYLPPDTAMLLMSGVFCGAIFGGSISAVLLGIPGTPASVPTAWEGFPLAKRGEAGRALHYCTAGSVFGGIVSSVALLLFAPVLAEFALKFGAPETMMLAIFGMTVVSSLTAGNMLKGGIIAFLSLLLACIGQDPINGYSRFTFGNPQLIGGLSLVPVLIGIFSLPEVFNLIEEIVRTRDQTHETKRIKVGSMKISFHEMLSHAATMLKSAVIGVVIGIIPAASADVAAFLAYNESKRASKHPETYMNGEADGLMASETANNAVTGASLIPLLTLSIPGSAPAALYLGVLYVNGLRPGTTLFEKNAATVYTLMAGFLVVNILMYFVGLAYCKIAGNVVRVPREILVPIILVLCVVGSFACNHNWFDVWVMFIIGTAGYFLSKCGFPLSPIALGLILGPIFEPRLAQTRTMFKGNFLLLFTRPICVVFMVLIVVSLTWPLIHAGFKKLMERRGTT